MRALAITLFTAVLIPLGAAYAQIPGVVGQQPGTLQPAPAVVPPPPLAVPAPVPRASSGPPSVFQGTAQSGPNIYYNQPLSGSARTVYRHPPKKKHKKHCRPRVSESEIAWRIA
jgi:hypothetical protein